MSLIIFQIILSNDVQGKETSVSAIKILLFPISFVASYRFTSVISVLLFWDKSCVFSEKKKNNLLLLKYLECNTR